MNNDSNEQSSKFHAYSFKVKNDTDSKIKLVTISSANISFSALQSKIKSSYNINKEERLQVKIVFDSNPQNIKTQEQFQDALKIYKCINKFHFEVDKNASIKESACNPSLDCKQKKSVNSSVQNSTADNIKIQSNYSQHYHNYINYDQIQKRGSNSLTQSITCLQCNRSNFPGPYYQCLICYQQYLCEQCEEKSQLINHLDRNHPFAKIKNFSQIIRTKFVKKDQANANPQYCQLSYLMLKANLKSLKFPLAQQTKSESVFQQNVKQAKEKQRSKTNKKQMLMKRFDLSQQQFQKYSEPPFNRYTYEQLVTEMRK